MKTRQICWLTVIMPFSLHAQLLSVGVQGGVPAQTPLGQSTSRLPFVVGPTIELRMLPSFSLESGVLFHRLGHRTDTYGFAYPENAFTFGAEQWRATAIEVPFLAKYRFLNERRSWRPFLAAGPAVRRTSIDYSRGGTVFGGTPLTTPAHEPATADKSVKWNVDPVVAAGVAFRSGRLTIEPQVRYSYWGAGKESMVRKNQVHFLFGLRF